MGRLRRIAVMSSVQIWMWLSNVCAATDDPKGVVDNYSTQMIAILKGPIAKVLSFIILLACVGALLRGRHKLAISCGMAFIVLLFLQVI
jgi:type IV secretory pathway VirB2 component (pilin)